MCVSVQAVTGSEVNCALPPNTAVNANDNLTSFDRTSLSNMKEGSSLMWFHLIFTWVVALLVMKVRCPPSAVYRTTVCQYWHAAAGVTETDLYCTTCSVKSHV